MEQYNFPYTSKMILHMLKKHGKLTTDELYDKTFTWFKDMGCFVDCLSKLSLAKKIKMMQGYIHLNHEV